MVMLVSDLLPIAARADEADRRWHLVVIFQENVSFDHYFATYPDALNLPGEPVFTAHHLRRR